MIVEIFLSIVWLVIFGLTRPFAVLSDVTAESWIVEAVTQFNAYLQPVDNVFPTTALTLILGFLIAFEIAYLLWQGVNWLIRKIPTIS